jgi:type I restriction enzyme R subunit
MTLSESDTRAKLIDPAIHARGCTEDLIRREETAGAIEIVDGQPRKRSRGRVDYTLRVKVNPDTQPIAVDLIEAKAEEDTRTPEELLDLIEAKGREVAEALALLRRG